VSFCVLFVCKCVLNYCHRVATQLQLINISSHILSYHIISYSDTTHSVGLPWTSGQPDAQASTWQHTTIWRGDIYTPGRIRTSNSSKRAVADTRLRPRGRRDRPQNCIRAIIIEWTCFLFCTLVWKIWQDLILDVVHITVKWLTDRLTESLTNYLANQPTNQPHI
jgi:hypothetical protein